MPIGPPICRPHQTMIASAPGRRSWMMTTVRTCRRLTGLLPSVHSRTAEGPRQHPSRCWAGGWWGIWPLFLSSVLESGICHASVSAWIQEAPEAALVASAEIGTNSSNKHARQQLAYSTCGSQAQQHGLGAVELLLRLLAVGACHGRASARCSASPMSVR
jgi:hypothetical protein